MKRFLSLALAALMLMTAGSAVAAVTVNPGGVFPITSEPITLSVWVEGYADRDMTNNGWLQETAELTNVYADIITSSNADAMTKRNLLLASGDYPDVFLTDWPTVFSKSDVMQFGVKEGILVPITGYLEEYGYEINKLFEYNPLFRTTSTAPDGEIYGVARFSECYHCMAYPKMYMRTDWLETLGLEMPTTTEEFRDVLKAFVTQDPNGNGEADEIGVIGATTWNTPVEYCLLGWSFQNIKPDFWLFLNDEGNVAFSASTDDYREGLRYIKSLYDDGLIDPASFSQKEDQLSQTVRMEPKVVGAYVADHMAMGVEPSENYEYKTYQVMMPLKGPSGFQHQPQNANEGEIQGFHAVITDVCEYPEAAFRWIDYMLGEEQMTIRSWGKEGVGWERAAEGTLDLFGNPAKYVQINTGESTNPEGYAINRAYSFGAGPIGDTADRRMAQLPAVEDKYALGFYEQRITLDTVPLLEYIDPVRLPATLFVDLSVSDEYNEIKTNLNDFVRKTCVQFIMGERNIETGWDAYLAELQRFNVDRYVSIYQDAYNATLQ